MAMTDEARKALYDYAMRMLQNSGVNPDGSPMAPLPPTEVPKTGNQAYDDAIQQLINSGQRTVDMSGVNAARARYQNEMFTEIPRPAMSSGSGLTPTTTLAEPDRAGWSWKSILGSFGGFGSAVTQSGYDWLGDAKNLWRSWSDGKFNMNDFRPLGDLLQNSNPITMTGKAASNAGKYQWNEWAKGKPGMQWEDIPGVGTLALMNENNKHGEDILKDQLGVKNNNWATWGGLGIDLLSDPTMYVTGGATGAMNAAGKLAAKTAAEEAGVIAKLTRGTYKIPFTKIDTKVPHLRKNINVDDVADQTFKEVFDNTGDFAKANAAEDSVRQASNVARGGQQNALLSVGVPFTGKAWGVGTKPEWMQRMFNKAPAVTGSFGAANVIDRLAERGLSPDEITKFLKENYNVDAASDLPMDAYEHLNEWLHQTELKHQRAGTVQATDPFADASKVADEAGEPSGLVDEAGEATPPTPQYPDLDARQAEWKRYADEQGLPEDMTFDDASRLGLPRTGFNFDAEDEDLYNAAVQAVMKHGVPSADQLREDLKIRYPQAHRLLNRMKDEGLINDWESDAPQILRNPLEGQPPKTPEPPPQFPAPKPDDAMSKLGINPTSVEDHIKQMIQSGMDTEDIIDQILARPDYGSVWAASDKMVERLRNRIEKLRQTGNVPRGTSSIDDAMSKLGVDNTSLEDRIKQLAASGLGKDDIILDILNQKNTYGAVLSGSEANRTALGKLVDKIMGGGGTGAASTIEHAAEAAPEMSAGYKLLMDNAPEAFKAGEWENTGRYGLFNSRTFGRRDPESGAVDNYINSAAGVNQDALNKIFGQAQQIHHEELGIGKMIKDLKLNGLTDDDKRTIAYLMQGKFPKNFAAQSSERTDKLKKIAKKLSQIEHRMWQQSFSAGSPIKSAVQWRKFPHSSQLPDSIWNKNVTPENLPHFDNSTKQFETLADHQDYIDALTKSKVGKSADEQANIDALIQDAKDALPANNSPIDSVFSHAREASKMAANTERNKILKDMGLVVASDKERPATLTSGKMWHELTREESNHFGLSPKDKVHPVIYDALKKQEEVFTVAGANQLLDTFQSITNIIKSSLTILKPVHFWNNVMGNLFVNTLAGVRVEDYKAATNLWKAWRNGTMTDKEAYIMQEAMNRGVFGQGFMSEFKRAALDTTDKGVTTLERIQHKAAKADIWVRNIAEKTPYARGGVHLENITRLSNFMNGLSKTGDYAKAAKQVRTYLFNYHEMTNADKVMRFFVPFWMWTKNNLPLQFSNLLKNPRVYQSYMKLLNTWNDTHGGENSPDWAKDKYLKLGKFGLPINLPLSDLEYADAPIGVRAFQKFESSLNPFFKVPAEVSQNKQFFTGKPINWDTPPGEPLGTWDAAKYAGGQLGLPSSLYKMIFNSKSGTDQAYNALGFLIGKPYDYGRDEKNQRN